MFIKVCACRETRCGNVVNIMLPNHFGVPYAKSASKCLINNKVYKIFAPGNSAVSEVAGEGLTLPVSD